MQSTSMGNQFNTAAELLPSSTLDRVKDLCRHTVSRHLWAFGLKDCSAVTKHLIRRKNQKGRPTFAEDDVVWPENWYKVHFSDESKFNLLGPTGNIMLVVKLGKDWTKSA